MIWLIKQQQEDVEDDDEATMTTHHEINNDSAIHSPCPSPPTTEPLDFNIPTAGANNLEDW